MEEIKILEFISYNNGYGSGCGDGYGYGSGYGYGYGYGSGYGYGDGYGDGSGHSHGGGYGAGDGSGFSQGDGLISINSKKAYRVDGIPTTISHIHGNTAKGTIVNNDLTETPCYIVKEGNNFAHGKTLAEANTALQNKLLEIMPIEERIVAFWECHKKDIKYPTKDFFEWHHKLTGSCLMGRQQFAKDHDVDLEGEMTVEEFITLTENSFGGDIIRQLEEN